MSHSKAAPDPGDAQKELRKLEEAEIITYAPPMITIVDADALQDVLSQ